MRAPARVTVMVAVLGAFFGLATAAHAQPGNVAVFNNPDYVDNAELPFGAEGPNTIDSLQSFGETVTPFTDFSAAGITAALAGKDSLVIPEEEDGCVDTDMADDAKAVIRNFVQSGGQLVVMAMNEDNCNLGLTNDIFGFSITGGSSIDSATRLIANPYLKTADAAGTEFADGPDSLPANNATGAIDETSLPAGSKSIYSDGIGNSAVADIPFGDGSITTLGWDWYDSNPPDDGTTTAIELSPRQAQGGSQTRGVSVGQDGGWQDVLRRSVDLPLLSVNDVSLNEGNSGTTPATFTVTASQNHSEVIHASYATADGTATAPSDYAATSGTLSIDRSALSTTVSVPVVGDTVVEPNETFSLNLGSPFPAAIADGSGVGTIVNDDVAAPPPPAKPAKPKVSVAGVRRACTRSSSIRMRFSITAPGGIKSVTVRLDGRKVTTTTKSRFTIRVNVKKLKAGRHRVTAVAVDKAGQKTTVRRTIARCAVAKPKHRAAPRFTG